MTDLVYEIWAVDAGAGEAVLSHHTSWYLVSVDTAWRPKRLEPHDVFRWAMSGWVVNVGSQWATEAEAISEARRICHSGAKTSSEVKAILDTGEERREARHLLVQETGRLDRFFERQGLSVDEAVDMTLGAAGRLDALEVQDEESFDLSLFKKARGLVALGREASELPSSLEKEPWRDRVLDRLPPEVLESLALWADGQDETRVAIALHRPLREVQGHVARAAGALQRKPEELRTPGLVEACWRRLRP